ncbi:hypothetical protein Lal_00000505 [Lupinus albus]|nr:hypothetical protein Lal_00000505 [Lupinus albus]
MALASLSFCLRMPSISHLLLTLQVTRLIKAHSMRQVPPTGSGKSFNKPQCHLCIKYDIEDRTLNYYHRYDTQYHDHDAALDKSRLNNSKGRVVTAESFTTENSPMTVPEILYDAACYPDYGASNHLAPEPANLMGKYKLIMVILRSNWPLMTLHTSTILVIHYFSSHSRNPLFRHDL